MHMHMHVNAESTLSNALYMHTLYVFWYNGPLHVLTVHFPLMRVVQGVSNSASNVIKTLDNKQSHGYYSLPMQRVKIQNSKYPGGEVWLVISRGCTVKKMEWPNIILCIYMYMCYKQQCAPES